MIKVTFVAPNTKAWKRWLTDSEKETEKLITLAKSRKAYEIKKLYARRKSDIFQTFFDKCAFCESKISVSQPGDVEHFRPKGGITDERGRPIILKTKDGKPMLDRQRQPKLHPGYYWLAYNWQNLLPSCSKCNRPNKKTIFPVKGFRATAPGDERKEKPLLLHPLLDEPEEHFLLDVKRGILAGRTREGKACIKILDLNREGLIEKRRDAYKNLVSEIELTYYKSNDPRITKRKLNQIITELRASVLATRAGRAEYAYVARLAIRNYKQLLEPFQDRLAEPPPPPAPAAPAAARKAAKKAGRPRQMQ